MYIAFLWHMHQPFYKDIFKKSFLMPWAFLHTIKDYYDMIKLTDEFENIKLNFNFVPSLLEQILDYSDAPHNDYFLKIVAKDVKELTNEEKENIIRQIFCVNYENMVLPFKRFRKLYEKKEFTNSYHEQELLDLEVLYLISWSGYFIKKNSKIVSSLIEKGEFFTEDDKKLLLAELFNYLRKVIPMYKEKLEKNIIEISTSPYYHPILPLLIDISSAKISIPEIKLPKINNSFYNDAQKHIENALKQFKKIFGKNCNGMWPSEGAVSNETISLINKNQIKWIATDEDILFNSKTNLNRKDLYYPYNFNGVNIFFRDKDLSNLIGFIYSKWHYKDAASDFYQRIKNIENMIQDDYAIISIILDGENAWEFYENNGIPFLKEIYKKISEDSTLNFITFSEYLDKFKIRKKLERIHPGSWINANYGVWIGHPEENKAWELIDNAKSLLNNSKNNKNYELAEKELLIAQGSDWFWWYGDDFYSEMSDKFDSLFRTHIANIYSFLNEDIPFDVLQPIKSYTKDKDILKQPYNIISPKIDGLITNYFEWKGAGISYFYQKNSTMHYGDYFLTKLYFGFNNESLFLRLDAISNNINEIFNDCLLEINIDNNNLFKITYNFNSEKIKLYQDKQEVKHNIQIKHRDIIEISIPFADLNIALGEEIKITLEITKNNYLIERAPYDSAIIIKIPENLYLEYWSV